MPVRVERVVASKSPRVFLVAAGDKDSSAVSAETAAKYGIRDPSYPKRRTPMQLRCRKHELYVQDIVVNSTREYREVRVLVDVLGEEVEEALRVEYPGMF